MLSLRFPRSTLVYQWKKLKSTPSDSDDDDDYEHDDDDDFDGT